MLLVHKIALKPNNKQATYFKKACGVARFSYNWALAEWQRQYESGGKPSEVSLRKQLNAIKKDEFPWMLDVTKVAPQQAIKNLGSAFNRFFKHQGKYPSFKKKGIRDSFRADNGPVKVGDNAVQLINKKINLPRIGWIKLQEELRFQGQIKSVTVSRKADRWFAAVSVETNQLPHERKNHAITGIDLGIKTFAQLSGGESFAGAKPHTQKLKRLKRVSRSLSAKKKGSANYAKTKIKLSRLHVQISNIRSDYLHKTSTDIVLNHSRICIEDLHVAGMAKNRKLSRHIMDQSFSEFRRQLEYKSKWYGSELIIADRFFPSSKMCSACHEINNSLTLSDRHWICDHCGITHDRDLNAATNLEKYEVIKHKNNTVSSTEIYACGEEGSGAVALVTARNHASLKQEFNIEQV